MDVNTHEAYDPATGIWEKLAPLPTAREHMPAVRWMARSMCPADALKLSSTTPIWHEVYDPVTNSWVEAAPLPTPRSGTAGAVLDGRVLVFGG